MKIYWYLIFIALLVTACFESTTQTKTGTGLDSSSEVGSVNEDNSSTNPISSVDSYSPNNTSSSAELISSSDRVFISQSYDILQVNDSAIKYAYTEFICDSGAVLDNSFDRDYTYKLSYDTLFIDHKWSFDCQTNIYLGSGESLYGDWNWVGMVYNDSCKWNARNIDAGAAGYTKLLSITHSAITENLISTYDCYTEDAREFHTYWNPEYTAIDCDTYTFKEDVISVTTQVRGDPFVATTVTYEYEDYKCANSLGSTQAGKVSPEYCAEIEEEQEEFIRCMSEMCGSIYSQYTSGMARECTRSDISDRTFN